MNTRSQHARGSALQIGSRWLLALSLLISVSSAHAAGDAELGAVKAETCLGCHNVPTYFNVYPTYRVPRVWGQNAPYIVSALEAYKSGQREHPTMQAQAADLSTQDMQDIAAFFAGDGPAPVQAKGEPPAQAAVCTACHGVAGVGSDPQFPVLSGLPESYLVNVLNAYKAGCGDEDFVENGRCNAIMSGQVAALSQDDIKVLAKFYSSQNGGVAGKKPE